MNRSFVVLGSLLLLAGCGPAQVQGDDTSSTLSDDSQALSAETTPAEEAEIAARVTNHCGPNYTLLHKYRLHESISGASGPGHVRLYINWAAEKKCAMTVSSGRARGVKKYMFIEIRNEAGTQHIDNGDFTDYAGPVKAKALPTSCVWLDGFERFEGNVFEAVGWAC